MILCKGSTNSPIDIHKSSLELFHLFGTTSLDPCLTQNHNFFWKLRKLWTDQDIVAYLWTPHFGSMRFPLDDELNFCFRKNDLYWLRKWLGVAIYFCFIFKRVNKIRKKTLNATPYFGKGDLRKTGSGSRVRLLIGKVR